MLVLVVEPEKRPYTKEIDGRLETMQELVGGYIEALYPFEDLVALVCNEEGKLSRLPPNRVLYGEDGKPYDIVSGTFFICGAPDGNDDFASLTEEQVSKFTAMFNRPERFVVLDDRIFCLPME